MSNEMNPQDEQPTCQNKLPCTDWAQSAIVSGMTSLADSQVELDTEQECKLAALLEAVTSGDREAFVTLYDTTVQRVFSLALRITRRQELAEEVVSDVYLQVWRKAETYSPERGKVIAWLCVLCRSRSLDALRRDNTAVRQAAINMDAVPESADTNEPIDILQAVEEDSAIHAALGQLTEQRRQLVALAYFRGYTHSELADFMGIPIGTVKTHLRRTMMKLKELMSSETDVNGESNE